MMPLFPRDEDVCTKIQIQVQLRRCGPQEGKAALKVVELDSMGRMGRVIKASQQIPMARGDVKVQEEMSALLKAEHGELANSGKKICKTRAIVLEIESPNVPSIDFVDMPGLTADSEHLSDTRALRGTNLGIALTVSHAMFIPYPHDDPSPPFTHLLCLYSQARCCSAITSYMVLEACICW